MPEAGPLAVSKRTTEWAKGYAGGHRAARPPRTLHLRRGEASAPRILRISEDAALTPGLTSPTVPSSSSPSAPQGSALGLSGPPGLGAPGQPPQGREHSAPRGGGRPPGGIKARASGKANNCVPWWSGGASGSFLNCSPGYSVAQKEDARWF